MLFLPLGKENRPLETYGAVLRLCYAVWRTFQPCATRLCIFVKPCPAVFPHQKFNTYGELSEWSKVRNSKFRIRKYRGFKSLTLRQNPLQEIARDFFIKSNNFVIIRSKCIRKKGKIELNGNEKGKRLRKNYKKNSKRY